MPFKFNPFTGNFDTVSDLSTYKTYTSNSITTSATPSPVGSSTENMFFVTDLAEAATIAAPSGTLVNGNILIIRIKDNGTARALTWNAVFRASSDLALPSTTILSKTLYCGFRYNSADSKWDLVSVLNNF